MIGSNTDRYRCGISDWIYSTFCHFKVLQFWPFSLPDISLLYKYIGLYALTNRLAVIWCKNSFANFQVNHGLNNCYRYDSVIGVVAEHDGTTERLVERHPLFGNNFGRQDSEVVHSKTLIQFFSGWTTRREKGVYDTIVYVLATVFHVSQATLQVILLCLLFLDKLHPCTVLNFLLLNQLC